MPRNPRPESPGFSRGSIKNKFNLLVAAIMTVFTYVVLVCVFLAAFNLIGPDANNPRVFNATTTMTPEHVAAQNT